MDDKGKIEIEWLFDESDCETCGPTWATGAVVKLNGEIILSLIPSAYCCGSDNWEEDDVYKMIFKKLGYTVEG